MVINIEDLEKLKLNADKIFLTAEGEETLVALLEIQKQVEDAIVLAEKKLEETALKLNPNFNSIQADKVKVYYRAYGAKYYIEEDHIDMVPTELYTKETKTVYKLDAKAVEKWADGHEGMPAGIKEVERTKQLKFSLKTSAKEE
jgi:hypothetical protein